MALCQPLMIMRDSIYYNPPKATFLTCLLILAVSFICFSSYTYTHTLPNPDTTKVCTELSTFYCCIILKLSTFILSSMYK